MSEPPVSPLRFLGVPAHQLGNEFAGYGIGDVVMIDYAGVSYRARVTARKVDYDDFGTEVTTYDLEVTGTA